MTIGLLQSIPGIDFPKAAIIIAKIDVFSVFSKSKKLIVCFGIDILVIESGEFIVTHYKISKICLKQLCPAI